MRRIALLMSALLLGILGMAAPASATWTNPPSDAYRVIEYNIGSGSECSQALEDCLVLLKNQINAYTPDAVLVEEVCYSDYLNLKAWLLGRTATANFDVEYAERRQVVNPASYASTSPDPTGLGCPTSTPGVYEGKGQVLAGEFGTISRYALMNPVPGYTYTLLCGIPSVGPTAPTRVCVTHLEAGSASQGTQAGIDGEANRKHELRVIQNLKDGIARDTSGNLVGPAWSRPAIGGDFNASPADSYWGNFMDDTMTSWTITTDPNYATTGPGVGTYDLTDPDTSNGIVDRVTYRNKAGMSSSMYSVASNPGTSTHDLRKSWVRY